MDTTPVARAAGLPTLLTEKQFAKYVGRSIRTIRNWRQTRTGPPWLKPNRMIVLYRAADVEAWLATKVRQPVAEKTAGQQRRRRVS